MNDTPFFCRAPALLLLAGFCCGSRVQANPTGGTVAPSAATINTTGSQLTINQSAPIAFINWQSFNIGAGETTTFAQPSSSSVAWNQINDVNASQIFGNLNANGYVVLQNPNGFYIGGTASISAHNLILTTASTPNFNLSSGGPWSFNAPSPTAQIINYGQIKTTGGGSVFLIASDIENRNGIDNQNNFGIGTISAPDGKIGLYAGEHVLVSTSPDGRGLSAEVTLPTGSVDNQGNLIADAGSIVAHAKMVNQDGLIQANSAQNVNGTIELLASDSLALGARSTISAKGEPHGASDGGSVTLKSEKAYSDQAGSTIDISGGAQGGNGGSVEISAANLDLNSLRTGINGHASAGFSGGTLTIDPTDLTINSGPPAPILVSGLYQIILEADHNITFNTIWDLVDPGAAALLTLTAGNNIVFNNGSGINAGNNWSLSLTAGTSFVSTSAQKQPASGSDGIYLNGNAYLQTLNGNINLLAANEVQVGWTGNSTTPVGANSGTGSITTTAGGNISVTAVYGDVNTGGNPFGYDFQDTAPYFVPDPNLGGISTAAGGNVTIMAGGNITSYLPSNNDPNNALYDGGSGAFGSQPGNVTINAGKNVYGHYVLANGTGSITAQNGDVGYYDFIDYPSGNFALSLVKGGWSVNAPNGNIFLQEVRNPNGVFNNVDGTSDSNPGYYLFNYDPNASVSLTAGNLMEINEANLPRTADNAPVVFPPSLNIVAGVGGLQLGYNVEPPITPPPLCNVTLFQSPNAGLNITTSGDVIGIQDALGFNPHIYMSDSDNSSWDSSLNPLQLVGGVHASSPPAINSPDPVVVNVNGNIKNIDFYTIKETQITVGGSMLNSSYSAENLHPGDTSFVKVQGQIYYSPYYAFTTLSQPIVNIPSPDDPSQPGVWSDIFNLLVDPTVAAGLGIPSSTTLAQLKDYQNYFPILAGEQFPNQSFYAFPASNPGFNYNKATLSLGFGGNMSQTVRDWLNGWNGSYDSYGNKVFNTKIINGITYGLLDVIEIGQNGLPVIQNGHLVLDPSTFVPTSAIDALYTESQSSSPVIQLGLQIGGPGQFNVSAGSMELGNSQGIESWGITGPQSSGLTISDAYDTLADVTTVGANLDVSVTGDLSLLTSRIASMYGGSVTISAGGAMNLGSQQIPEARYATAFGIYTTGHSDVNVTAQGDINLNGSRIAAYNGGNVFVESTGGSVDVGSGGNTYVDVPLVSASRLPGSSGKSGSWFLIYQIYGSGIVTTSLPNYLQTPGGNPLPGNITVNTPQGNIDSSSAGVLQLALDGSVAGGPTITLSAGTAGVLPTTSQGNINLGNGGAIGGTVNLKATGNINGVIVSRQNSTIDAGQNFSGTLLSGGSASLSAGGSASGTIIGIGGISASAGSLNATLLSQNVSVGGASATSTLGTSATASSSSQSAAQQASSSTQEAVAGNGNSDDDQKKKKKAVLARRVGRVTVLLSAAMPAK